MERIDKPYWVIKVGGSVLEKADNTDRLFSTITKLQSSVNVVLVHGGGNIAQQLLEDLGFVSEKIDGVRVTPKSQLPYVVAALAGIANQQLCSQAIAAGLTPVGLSLSDGRICQAVEFDERFGAVGKALPYKADLLKSLNHQQMLPIVHSIGTDTNGQLLNVNADQAAIAICQLLNAELFLLSDVAGVLGTDGEVIPQLDTVAVDDLVASSVINGGMVVKVREALIASEQIQKSVTIASWEHADVLVNALSGESFGTQIKSEKVS